MKTKDQIRHEFLGYYSDFREAQIADECPPPIKSEVWEFFVGAYIDMGDLPESARKWPCPRK